MDSEDFETYHGKQILNLVHKIISALNEQCIDTPECLMIAANLFGYFGAACAMDEHWIADTAKKYFFFYNDVAEGLSKD
jgi:hypothetical protein